MQLSFLSRQLLLAAAVSATNLEVVDLGYQVYRGVLDSTTGLQNFLGIRFAAPPTGSLRWQAPQPPVSNRSSIADATAYGPTCIQNPPAPGGTSSIDNTGSSEDCLFLNVQAPADAVAGSLPVLVWIHGGGYGAGSARVDLSTIINANEGAFVGVSIQYRLGAFGFLAGDEVYRRGEVNAGILDQQFALKWVQANIGIFGGNASQVTIAGESAGGGSVMLHDISYGGNLGNTLFTNSIAASPYLPMQYGYKDWIPSQAYYAFATAAGCPPTLPYGGKSATIFECLVSQDSATLINASVTISGGGEIGTFAFLPVTDGELVPEAPSQALLRKRLNGRNLLVGNNADEGSLFVQTDITTEDDLVAWLELTFPLFSNDDIAKVLLYYPSTNASVNSSDPLFATDGLESPTAINQSDVAAGQQQRADNIYAETTFVCPSYWMAEAYSGAGRSSYKYQYSVGIATHGSDATATLGPATANQGPDFELAFQTIWGNFITTGNPSISAAIANGASAANSTSASAPNPATSWPAFAIYAPEQLVLNQTGGVLTTVGSSTGGSSETEYVGPGLRNDFTLANAYTWEGGRGFRCDFWRSLSVAVPE